MAHISHCHLTCISLLASVAKKSYAAALASRSNKRKPRIREHSTTWFMGAMVWLLLPMLPGPQMQMIDIIKFIS